MEKKITILACLMGLVLMTASGQISFHEKLKSLYRNSVPLIHSDELKTILEKGGKIFLLDTRALEEYNVSHIENARFIDYRSFDREWADNISSDIPIVVYCTVGYRSERIGERLIRMGFSNVRNLYGGIFEWVHDGNVIVNSFGKPTQEVHTYNKNWSQWLSRGEIVY